jgi:hypothetical protein
MDGFFIPGLGQGGGGGGQPADEAIVDARIQGTDLLLIKQNGGRVVVPLNAINIGFDDNTANLGTVNTQEAIEALKELLDETPNIYIENDNASLQNLLQSGNLKPGDIIYVENSTGVLEHTGKDVDNSGHPAVFIYDDTIPDPSNKLRLVSRIGNYAHRDRDNLMLGENTFKDLYVYDSVPVASKDYIVSGQDDTFGGRVWTGTRSVSTGLLSDGYVSKIRLYATSGTSAQFTGLDIFPVTKVNSKTDDIVQAKLDVPQSITVINDNGTYYFDVEIHKKFDVDTYFIVGSSSAGNDGRLASAGIFDVNDKINKTAIPVQGIGVGVETNQAWVAKYELFGRDKVDMDSKVDARPKKSFIVCVAGQSNAVGYDESPLNEQNSTNLNPNRLRQLGIHDGNNLKNIPLTHYCHALQNMLNTSNNSVPGVTYPSGTKGVHLPLGNLLLNEVPEDYEIIFLSMAYGGSSFGNGQDGVYNQDTKLPQSMTAGNVALRWGKDSAYYLTMKNRIQYLLDQNKENIFGGVIWIQGENDSASAATHWQGFTEMTNDFFNHFNQTENGKYKKQTLKNNWDRNLWYNVETVEYWYHQGECQQIWDNYYNWNPDTYVEIPRKNDSNVVNGTGVTSVGYATHFGNDAYLKVVAPRILEKMRENNGLFKQEVKKEEVNCVEGWTDLEHVTETYGFYNRYADATLLEGCLLNNGNVSFQNRNNKWNAVIVPVDPNKRYYIYNKRCENPNVTNAANILGGSNLFAYNVNRDTNPSKKEVFNATTYVSDLRNNVQIKTIGNKKVIEFSTIANITHIGFNAYGDENISNVTVAGVTALDELVVCEATYVDNIGQAPYVSHKEVKKVVVDGSKFYFDNDTLFDKLLVEAKMPYIGEDRYARNIAGGTKKTGRRDFTSHSHGNSGYVRSLLIRVSNGLANGAETGVTVWAITKRTDILQETVKKIKDNITVKVVQYNGQNFVNVPIETQYTEETYFIYQLRDSAHLIYSDIRNVEDAIYINDNPLDVTPQNINTYKNAQTVGVYWIIGDNVDVCDKLNGVVYEYKENYISGNTTLVDGYILGNPIATLNNTNATIQMGTNYNYSGSPSMSAGANVVVGDITIGMHDSLDIGSLATGVKVAVVQADNNTVIEHLTITEPVYVQKNIFGQINATKIISIPINKSWQNDVWFIVGAKGMLWGDRGALSARAVGGDNGLPHIGNQVSPTHGNYIGQVIIHGSKVSLYSLTNAGTGNLSTINNVQPIQGNINLSVSDKNTDVINLKVGDANFGTLECMTDNDVNDIKVLFV